MSDPQSIIICSCLDPDSDLYAEIAYFLTLYQVNHQYGSNLQDNTIKQQLLIIIDEPEPANFSNQRYDTASAEYDHITSRLILFRYSVPNIKHNAETSFKCFQSKAMGNAGIKFFTSNDAKSILGERLGLIRMDQFLIDQSQAIGALPYIVPTVTIAAKTRYLHLVNISQSPSHNIEATLSHPTDGELIPRVSRPLLSYLDKYSSPIPRNSSASGIIQLTITYYSSLNLFIEDWYIIENCAIKPLLQPPGNIL